MNNVLYKDNILVISEKKITLKYSREKLEKVFNYIIVLLDISNVKLGVEELNNILCFDVNGNLQWRISNILPDNIASDEQVPYVSINLLDTKLYATDFWGRRFEVDIATGKLLDFKNVH